MIDASPPGREAGVTTLIGRLVDDSRTLVSAEVALYKAKASERIAAYKSAVVFFAAAGVLALAALIALLVGLNLGCGLLLYLTFLIFSKAIPKNFIREILFIK